MAKVDPASFLRGLSPDNKIAFCELASKIREYSGLTPFLEEIDFALLAKTLEQFNNKRRLDISLTHKTPSIDWEPHLKRLLAIASQFEVDLRAEQSESEIGNLIDEISEIDSGKLPFGFAILSSDEKQFIRQKLDQVKNAIDQSKLHARKKNAHFSRIAKLAEEVDRDGTRTDGFFSFAIDLAMTAREMTQQAKPAIDDFKDVLRIVLNRRAESEGVSLPRPDDYPRLPGPTET